MTNWFIHARRNASLHHLSFLMVGLYGKGWMPAVDFFISETIVLGFPRKGGFVFLDKEKLHSGGEKLKDIQQGVDSNKNLGIDFRRRTSELFGAVVFACEQIDNENLSLLSKAELSKLYNAYIEAMLAGPLITVQVYGIEAMVDTTYKIIQTLENKLASERVSDLDKYKQIFLTNDGETVPLTERKDFYRICVRLDTSELRELFKNDAEIIEKKLAVFPEAETLIQKHIDKYYWVNTEYLGSGWTRAKWLSLFKEALIDSDIRPQQKLDELMASYEESARQKKDAIEELHLPDDVIHSIHALGVFLAERDWTKGYVARSLLSYHKLLNEVAKRIGISFEDLLSYSYIELQQYFDSGTTLSREELERRKTEGYAMIIREGRLSLFSGREHIDHVLAEEHIENPLKELPAEKEVKGLTASRGIATGRARVIDEPSKIPEFQDGEVLVTYMTTIEFTPLFRKAIAVVTDEGGMSCHAAIVSREFKLPCIVGMKVATRVIETGDTIEVDAINGIVRILEKGSNKN